MGNNCYGCEFKMSQTDDNLAQVKAKQYAALCEAAAFDFRTL